MIALGLSWKAAVGDEIDARFAAEVRPFLESYCIRCHGEETAEGDLDLSAFTSAAAVAADLARWERVREEVQTSAMPPSRSKKQPDASARESLVGWIAALRKREAAQHAGDPGAVPSRRLSNAEYDNTIRDLVGFDLRPTREFPVDPANRAGFDNSAESLATSPALVKKYLQAARKVADHVVVQPDGFAFAPHPMLAITDRDKYSVRSIIDFYQAQNTDPADYFLAAWKFDRRDALGIPKATLDALADEAGLSRKYLKTITEALQDDAERAGPIAALRVLWRALPNDEAGAREGCVRIRDFAVALRRKLTPEVPNMKARGISDGTQPFVLWKNRKLAENRMRYAGGRDKIRGEDFNLPADAALALDARSEAPADDVRLDASYARFCRVVPDAFYLSERARVYLDPKSEKGRDGRLLSAGFHSMTGYFRDDAPLAELLLDDSERAELDRLWRNFDFVADAPARQYSSYLWYERAETGYLHGEPEFDFVRAEDRDAASPEKMKRFETVYLAKARRIGAPAEAVQAIEDQFRIIARQIRDVEELRAAAAPRHVEALQRFAERAFRRPLSDAERRSLADFHRTLCESDGLSLEEALRESVAAVLMSPHFNHRLDLAPSGAPSPSGVRPLSGHELASRLSYFLWASAPDEELLSHASKGDLADPEILIAQTRRMLRDDRVRGLALEFGGAWLDFRRFEEHNSVDRGRFPTFDDELRRSMFEEPVRFFIDLVQNDRPAADFIEARRTFVNPPLAKHYGMPVPQGGADAWAPVEDASKYGRGGLLPMAVFLTRNSPGLRTSPVKRGYWVVKRLLGEEIPAPPADVPDLPEDESKLGDLTLRETLARHRADKACAGCHERFDAVGLAFEGYGPVGEARTRDLGDRPIDVHAAFPGGAEGDGLEGLRTYVQTIRRDDFLDNLARKLTAYALGRTEIPADDAVIAAMRSRLAAENGRFGALVEALVVSPPFLNKRTSPADLTFTPDSEAAR